MEYYRAIKRKAFESVLIWWMDLEPIIQSELSQKNKEKYCILRHTYGNYKDGTDDPICRSAKEMQTYIVHSRERRWRDYLRK